MVWYMGDEGPATLVRGSGAGDEDLKLVLSDWNRFRSASFFTMTGERQAGKNIPPFLRSYGGRQFVFIFNGSLKGDFKTALSLGGGPQFRASGFFRNGTRFLLVFTPAVPETGPAAFRRDLAGFAKLVF